MKKLLIAIVLLTGSLVIKAQAHVEWGIKGGLNLATLRAPGEQDMRTSFYLGGLAHIHLSREFAIQPELEYSGQGEKYTIGNTEHALRLNYLNLPVLVQYMFEDGFRVETGPQFGMLLTARDIAGPNSVEVTDDFNRMDFSWVFGAGYLCHSGFGVDVRYNLGISNINAIGSTTVNNSVFAIGAFYQLKK
jgi:hypothetical protein